MLTTTTMGKAVRKVKNMENSTEKFLQQINGKKKNEEE